MGVRKTSTRIAHAEDAICTEGLSEEKTNKGLPPRRNMFDGKKTIRWHRGRTSSHVLFAILTTSHVYACTTIIDTASPSKLRHNSLGADLYTRDRQT